MHSNACKCIAVNVSGQAVHTMHTVPAVHDGAEHCNTVHMSALPCNTKSAKRLAYRGDVVLGDGGRRRGEGGVYLWFHAAQQHDEHDDEAGPVFAVYAVHQHRVVLRRHKHTKRLGNLLLALHTPGRTTAAWSSQRGPIIQVCILLD